MRLAAVQPRRLTVRRSGKGYAAWEVGFYVWEEDFDEARAWGAELSASKPLPGEGRPHSSEAPRPRAARNSEAPRPRAARKEGLHGDPDRNPIRRVPTEVSRSGGKPRSMRHADAAGSSGTHREL